jgi:hypothetical protein
MLGGGLARRRGLSADGRPQGRVVARTRINASTSARSCGRPAARLLMMRSSIEITGHSCAPNCRMIRRDHAAPKSSPAICVRMSIRDGGRPIMKPAPPMHADGVASHDEEAGLSVGQGAKQIEEVLVHRSPRVRRLRRSIARPRSRARRVESPAKSACPPRPSLLLHRGETAALPTSGGEPHGALQLRRVRSRPYRTARPRCRRGALRLHERQVSRNPARFGGCARPRGAA